MSIFHHHVRGSSFLWRLGAGAAVVLTTLIIANANPGSVLASSQVSGTVKGPGNETISGQAQINCGGPSGGGGTQTESNGNFSFTLNPGNYQCTVIPPAGSSFATSLPVNLSVVDGVPTVITFNLATRQMYGKMMKADGTGIRGGLNVFNSDNTSNVHVEANEQGDYTLGGLPAGVYIAQPMIGWGVSGLTAPDQMQVTLGGDLIHQDFTFLAAAKSLTGTIRKSDGTPVLNACVNANKLGVQAFASTSTDASGKYTLSLSGGSWQVSPSPCNQNSDWMYAGNPLQVDFTTDTSSETKTLDVTVTTASSIVSGTLRDQGGNAIGNSDIDIRNSSGSGAHAQTGSDGSFSAHVAAGTYNINFWKSGYALPPTSVTVGDGQTVTLALVAKAKTAHIKGTVKTAGGVAAANVMINANATCNGPCPSQGGDWGNARSGADGSFDLLVAGAATYSINIGMDSGSGGSGKTYVSVASSQFQINVPTETSTVTPGDNAALNLIVVEADATIRVKFTTNGVPLPNVNGCAFARPSGSFNEQCSPMQNGVAIIKVASSTSTSWDIGCHFPSNAGYSCGSPSTVTVTAGGVTEKTLDLQANNSSIGGRLFDSSGFPLTTATCSKMKGSMVFADAAGDHFQGEIKADCSYSISLVAGVYNIGTFFTPESGVLNNQGGTPVQVFSGQSVQKNIQAVTADAAVIVTLLDQNGVGTQGYINVGNEQEIQNAREGNANQGGGQTSAGFTKNTPCNATDPQAILKCCSDVKNKTACTKFQMPDGPGKTKNAWDAAQYCKSNKTACQQLINQDQNSGGQPGSGPGGFTGPGGCKSDQECQKYCAQPAHITECQKFKPPASAQSIRISSIPKKVSASSTTDAGPGDKGNFNNVIRSGAQTDWNGKAQVRVLSGHHYNVCAGLPPDKQSTAMPPKCQDVDLTKAGTVAVVLQLRNADASVSGTVSLNGSPVSIGYAHVWCEDGSFNGSQISSTGQYSLNLVKGTCHLGAESYNPSTSVFARSDEVTLVVDGTKKKLSQNIKLVEQAFKMPKPVTVTGSCSSQLTLTLDDGTTISLPAGSISTTSDASCTVTATPTIDLLSTKSNQPNGVGYTIEARDENMAVVQKLLSSATVTFHYSLAKGLDGTDYEKGLTAAFYDSTAGAYQSLSNCSDDANANTITCTVDHFSAYVVANSTGTSSKNMTLKSVTTSKKSGVTSFTVNGKKVTPFKSKCDVSVVTTGVNGVQYVAAASVCEKTVKVYDTNGKLKKTITTGWSGTNTMVTGDVTKDGNNDLILAPISGKEVWVIDIKNKYKTKKVSANKTAVKLTANAIDFNGSGVDTLVSATVTNGTAGNFQVYKYSKSSFSVTTSSYSAYLKNSGGSIAFSIPNASVSKVSPTSMSIKKTSVKLTIKGKNFTPDTTVLIGGIAAKVSFKSTTQLSVTFNATRVKAGKYALVLTNPGGKALTSKVKVTAK